MKTDVLIVGGGLAGLSTAYHLGQLGIKSRLVVEAKDNVGGTAGSVKTAGFTFDYTGHLLHLHDPEGSRFILDLLKGNVASLERRAWIYSNETFTRYPFQANTYGLPQSIINECVSGFLETVHRPKALANKVDFLSWSRATFGDGITKYFMKPYNEKLWQTRLSKLTTEWQGRFVPKPSPAEVLYGALNDQNMLFGYNTSFRYPITGGIQVLPDALASRIEQGVVHTGKRVEAIDLRQKIAKVQGLGEIRYERLVNTIALVHFLDLAFPLPAHIKNARRRLRYNTVWNLNLGVGRADVSDKHWVYFPEAKFPFYRAGFSSNFSKNVAPKNQTAIYIEVSRPAGAKVNTKQMETSIIKGLREAGILKRQDEITAKIWMPIEVGYVVYDFARTPAVTTIFEHLKNLNIHSIGRYGAWKYSFMEETILDGKRCAQRLAGVTQTEEISNSQTQRALK